MGSRPSGSDVLVDVGTADVDLVVRSRKASGVAASEGRPSSLRIAGRGIRRVAVPVAGLSDGGGRPVVELAVPPMFFEQTDYAVAVRARGGGVLSFRSGSRLIDACVGRDFEDDGSRLSGVVNFGNDIGFSDLAVDLDGREALRVRLEVYPGKISYKEDYLAMMDDIERMVRGCVLDFMRRTYRGFVPDCRRSEAPAVFFTVLRTVYARYMQAVRRIMASPHHALVPEREVVPSRRAGRTDARSARWLERHPGCLRREGDAVLADRVQAVRKRTTYDTAENRFVRFMLTSTVGMLGDFVGRYGGMRRPDGEVLAEAEAMRRELRRLLTTGLLAGVSEYDAARSMSLVFGMAPGYRELYRCYLMLRCGIVLGGDVFRMSVKDTATLYEYWCFLKLYSILREDFELRSPDVVRADRTGVTVDLAKGRQSMVTFADPRNGETIRLVYNPRESGTQTVGQRPDNVLELEKVGASTRYKYVFDAKYRIEAHPDALYPDDMPGPKVDDVNTMHRYRDAIVCEADGRPFMFEKTMFGAYILFPYADEEAYVRHRFYRSIDAVNIGGLPFLPSATSLVRRLLDELIADSPASASGRAVLPAGVAERLAGADWSRRDVLIGLVPDDAHLDLFLKGRMYFTRSFDKANLPVRGVALYERRRGIRWYGQVIAWRMAARGTLPGGGGDVPYHVFEVAGWRRLPSAVAAGAYGPNPVAYTTEFLLGVAETYAELHIRSEAEYRLLAELRRRTEASVVEGGDGMAFDVGGARVRVDGDRIVALRDGGEAGAVGMDEFVRRPWAALRRLRGRLRGKDAVPR